MSINTSSTTQEDTETNYKIQDNKELLFVQSIFPDLSNEERQNRQKMLEIYFKNIKMNDDGNEYSVIKTFDDPSLYDIEEIQSVKLEIAYIFEDVLPSLCTQAIKDLIECSNYLATPMSIDDNIIKEIKSSSMNNLCEWQNKNYSRYLKNISVLLVGSTLFELLVQIDTNHKGFPLFDVSSTQNKVIVFYELENSKDFLLKTIILIEEIMHNISSRSIVNIIEIVKQCIAQLYKVHSQFTYKLNELPLSDFKIKDRVKIKNTYFYSFITYYISNSTLVLYYLLCETTPNATPDLIKNKTSNYKINDILQYDDIYMTIVEVNSINIPVSYLNNVLTTIERYLDLFENLQDKINAIWSITNTP